MTLSWTDNSAAETGFSVERATENKAFVEIAVVDANKVSYEDRDVQAGIVYTYRIRAFNQFGYSSYSNAVSKKLPVTDLPEFDPATNPEKSGEPSGGPVPNTLIGAHKDNGYYDYLDDIGTHLLGGSGKGLQGYSDSLRFAYSSTEENASVTLYIPEITTSAEKAQASLQFRQSLAHDSPYIALTLNHRLRAGARWRASKGAKTQATDWRLNVPAHYLRLSRKGDSHTLETSLDGFQWSQIAAREIQLSDPYLVGFGIASRANEAASHGIFEILESNVLLLPPSYSKYGPDPTFACTANRDIDTFFHIDEDVQLYSLGVGGKGIETIHDELVFPNWQGEGPVRIAARVLNFNPDGNWARFGLAIRSGKKSDAAFAAIAVNGMDQIEALWRTTKGSEKEAMRDETSDAATYIAIEFDDTKISLQYSYDGANWISYAEKTIQLGSTYRIGPFIGSQNGYSTGSLQVIGLY